ncbi:excalibur calcium-binding domain-containing protein [Persicimonas caeni]|uniref:Excalibur calcium-binding domain-containing protein n=1 Tax=Persicimonas caeni TaxID=2292766 RepID=A0A4Y6PUX0_PERCE|nr:excalibur calcium-binding domain-containing protein [Persicimonas caeni]QDG52122.1 excalibur calcium-binding domain-containing protein [Persicimonas caeni]QED33343.1 excalibur calcium-binding domain-containing protein [Persicimonas caeni]
MRISFLVTCSILSLCSLTLAPAASAQDDKSDDEVVCSYDAYNCGDFSSCTQVMRVFEACESDVHKLDRDKDGVPCEALCD